MPAPTSRDRIFATFKRAFREFLAVPMFVVVGFIALGAIIYFVDDAWSRGHIPQGFAWLGDLLGDSKALAALLSTVASSIITVTSITFSLLLIALQQGAAALSTQVTDQFLMRRSNQLYFGFFVGLSVYVLLTLVTVSDVHRPIFGTSVALILTAAALCLIVVMIYNTIDQMRPAQIVHAIHQHILRARTTETAFLAETRRIERAGWRHVCTFHANDTGYVAAFKIESLQQHLAKCCPDAAEIVLDVRIGTYTAYRDALATLRAPQHASFDADTLSKIEDAVRTSIVIDNDRDLSGDPRYGIYQLSTIAWTSISTAKSNPDPGRAVLNVLRDVIARWSANAGEVKADEESAIVYADNSTMEAINVLEMIALVTSESMQAQTLTDTLNTIARLLPLAPQSEAERLADVVERMLSSLGEHVLTRDLQFALEDIAAALSARGFAPAAHRVREATTLLAHSLGRLKSRSTRVPHPET